MKERFIAASIINKIIQGFSLTDCLEAAIKDNAKDNAKDKAFVQAICYGVCRFYFRLDAMLSDLLDKPLKEKNSDIHALLLVGIYQLWAMHIPDYAVVTETVNATQAFKKPWARHLVNAVLRNYIRRQDEIEKKMIDPSSLRANDEEAYYSHPTWYIEKVKSAWPQTWQAILNANNDHPPFSLRVNQQRLSREAYQQKLNDSGLSSQGILHTKSGLILDTPLAVELLPGFSEGEISVQDGAAQLAAELLDLKPNQRVLDACAAPGGKLIHMLEIQPNLSIVAIEKNSARMHVIKNNLKRMAMQAKCICSDAANVANWWDNQLFDRILLDAPCSGSGVVRRHPDIKLLRQPDDVERIVKEQECLLKALWPLLKPGGLLLYVTCSIFPEENVELISRFFSLNDDAVEVKIMGKDEIGLPCLIGRQILPPMYDMDGFYFALMRKS